VCELIVRWSSHTVAMWWSRVVDRGMLAAYLELVVSWAEERMKSCLGQVDILI
jgi:hypothetical protein